MSYRSLSVVRACLFAGLAIIALLAMAIPTTADTEVTLTAVQMKVSPEIYRDSGSFYAAIHDCMEAAKPHFGEGENLVVFPEDVGLGLVLEGTYQGIPYYDWIQMFGVQTLEEAAGVVAYLNSDTIGQIMAQYNCSMPRALFIMQRQNIGYLYHYVFALIAYEYKDYNVTLVAGSAPIADDNGNVYNTSYVYAPGGGLIGEQRKIHLIDLEVSKLDLTPGDLSDLHPFDTPAGRIGVAICYDCFFDDVVDKLVAEGAQILVQPSFNPAPWTPWQRNDWRQGTWRALRMHQSLVAGVNPMMVGSLWDIVPEGRSSITAFTPTGFVDRTETSNAQEIVSTTVELD